jgi:hypothetical protein
VQHITRKRNEKTCPAPPPEQRNARKRRVPDKLKLLVLIASTGAIFFIIE